MDLPTPRSAGGPRGRLGALRLGDGAPDEDSGQVTPVLDARVEVGGGIALRGGRATALRRRRARRQRRLGVYGSGRLGRHVDEADAGLVAELQGDADDGPVLRQAGELLDGPA